MNVTSIFIAYVTIKLNLIQLIAGDLSMSVLKVGIFVFIITNTYLITVTETEHVQLKWVITIARL